MTRYRRLAAWIIAAAALVTCAGPVIGTNAVHIGWLGSTDEPPSYFVLACAIAGLAQLPRLKAGRSGSVRMAWGEAAIIVLCYLLPVAWIPAALLVGVGGAHTILTAVDRRRVLPLVVGVASLTLAGTAAAVVARAIAPTQGAALHPRTALALCVGALTYYLVSIALMAGLVVRAEGGSFRGLLRETAQTKLLMVIGNVAIGLLVVALHTNDQQWLVLIPPVVWLLHQAYAYRLRGDAERRAWEEFTEATRELSRLDEWHAAAAGIAGALRLFKVTNAEIVVHEPGGPDRVYAGEAGGPVVRVALQLGSAGRGQPPGPEVAGAVHPLVVGDSRVGELRLRPPLRNLTHGRDRYMFAAYGDALAAALHDSATHSELLAITERRTHDAIHDPLTGVVNRAALLSMGNVSLRRLDPGAPVALLLFDVNRFKEINNALGHANGDEILRIVANRLRDDAHPGELLARLGGDEFAVLVTAPDPDPDGREPAAPEDQAAVLAYAIRRARRLTEVLAEPVDVAGVQLSVEASVGVVVATAGSVDMTELLRRADIAMYQAKDVGQAVSWYEPSRDEASTDRLALLAEMREALAGTDQIHLLLQPVVSLEDGAVIGVEALARWQHPRRGPLEPADFLAPVELSEMIGPFTRYVLNQALAIVARWRGEGIDLPISVNLSARGLLDPALPSDVEAMLLKHGVPAGRLILEITESVVVAELPVIDEVLTGLRARGVRLAVDDFGTGFSSLTFLTRVPVDEVKIDRAFIDTMVDSPEAAAIVRTTVELGRELNLRVVAEGVETAEQRAALVVLRCPAAQGYHFFPPMTPDKAMAVLKSARRPNLRRLRVEDAG